MSTQPEAGQLRDAARLLVPHIRDEAARREVERLEAHFDRQSSLDERIGLNFLRNFTLPPDLMRGRTASQIGRVARDAVKDAYAARDAELGKPEDSPAEEEGDS